MLISVDIHAVISFFSSKTTLNDLEKWMGLRQEQVRSYVYYEQCGYLLKDGEQFRPILEQLEEVWTRVRLACIASGQ